MILSEGEKKKFCPYYYGSKVKEIVDLIFMPYNYLTDAKILKYNKDIVENSILIFDEAHNVADAACEGRSFEINARILGEALKELEKLQSKDPSISSLLRETAKRCRHSISLLIGAYSNLQNALKESAQKGPKRMAIEYKSSNNDK
jgi:Rad3-related DNA helicase